MIFTGFIPENPGKIYGTYGIDTRNKMSNACLPPDSGKGIGKKLAGKVMKKIK